MPDGPPGAADPPLRLRSHWPVLVLAVLAGLIAVLAHELIFPALSWNRDEPVYLWHMEVLRQGQLTATDGGHPDLFLPWLSAAEDGEMFTQYTLGWPRRPARRLACSRARRPARCRSAPRWPWSGTYALAFELTQRRRIAVLAGSSARGVADPRHPGRRVPELPVHARHRAVGGRAAALRRSASATRPVTWRRGCSSAVIFITRPYDAILWGAAFALGLLLTAPDRSDRRACERSSSPPSRRCRSSW